MSSNLQANLDRPIRFLVVAGLACLPYTHLRWMPDLGTTRPLSAVFFALAFGLIVLQSAAVNGWNLKKWLAWPKTWTNWPMLRWWLWLIGLGILSATLVLFYGLPVQALLRLLGYLAIFITLFIAAYSLPRYGIHAIARWTALGYLPVLAYGLVESLAVLHFNPALAIILWLRETFFVPFPYSGRLALTTTEASFVSFQVLLLALFLPYLREKWLRICMAVLVLMSLLFSQSGTLFVMAAIYLGLWLLFTLSRPILARLTVGALSLGALALLVNAFLPQASEKVNNLTARVGSESRLYHMAVSSQIRLSYILNLLYALIDTRGLGLGIGQYGKFWREIYLRNIDYRRFDLYGEVSRALSRSGDYMKPWSVLLGIGVDLGIAGLFLEGGFFWQVYRQMAEPRHRALFFACLVGLAGAYPIVTPHLWLALGLMAGLGVATRSGAKV